MGTLARGREGGGGGVDSNEGRRGQAKGKERSREQVKGQAALARLRLAEQAEE